MTVSAHPAAPRAVSVLDGTTFCVGDERGDVVEGAIGLIADDTRFLSRFELLMDGKRLLPLTSGRVEYFSAAFYLRNAVTELLAQDVLTVVRHRFVGESLHESITIENESLEVVLFGLELVLGADFADVLSIKERDLTLGHPERAGLLPPTNYPRPDKDGRLVIHAPDGPERTFIVLDRDFEPTQRGAVLSVVLEPGRRFELAIDVVPCIDGCLPETLATEEHFGEQLRHVRDALDAWHVNVPRLRTGWPTVRNAVDQAITDLASLRIKAGNSLGRLPAAGMPWFMTVFGRDTAITCLETMLLGPELAQTALRTLAALQATADDTWTDAEPGKIPHELRRGRAATSWFPVYYGTIDATPLFLILLSETWRWTGDDGLATELREPALAALDWIDHHGDRDGDGFVEYETRSARGLVHQSWKDSDDPIRFSDGTLALTPIAPVETQGYVYDAKRRVAEIARAVWRDSELAGRLEHEAAELARRFDEAFWCDGRSGYYALALDGEKRRVDALCSNIGHLLWSGIVPEPRVEAVVDRLMSEQLFSGWGFRTMSTADLAYSPISYHRGTVWPHDTALAAWGLARHGRWDEAWTVARALLAAAGHFDWSLPEVFAGFPRSQTPFPVAYPTSSRPQAWAAGAAILSLQLLLGLRTERRTHRLVSDAPAELPGWMGAIHLHGVLAFGERWDVDLAPDGPVQVTRS